MENKFQETKVEGRNAVLGSVSFRKSVDVILFWKMRGRSGTYHFA